jgi:hypothetical protein
MRAEQSDDNGRIDEDDGVGDNHERRTLDCTPRHTAAALLSTRQVIAALEQYAGHERKGGSESSEGVGDGDRKPASTGASISGEER